MYTKEHEGNVDISQISWKGRLESYLTSLNSFYKHFFAFNKLLQVRLIPLDYAGMQQVKLI